MLRDVVSSYANPPIELPADIDAVRRTLDRLLNNSGVSTVKQTPGR
jgi:hypothetical protein